MNNVKKSFQNIGILIGVIAVWWIASKAINKELFLPSPEQTMETIGVLYATGALWKHLASTFLRVTFAILITGVISVPFGMLIAWYKPINKVFKPIVDSLRFIPVTAFSPMLILLLGIDEPMKVTFLVVATLFSFLPSVIQICTEVESKLKETAYTMGFSYTRCIMRVLIPYITPSLLKSFVTLYGVGWTFVIIAEVTNTQYGLGHLMYIGSARGRTSMVFAAIIIVVVVSFVFDKIANFIIDKKFAWRYGNEK